MQNRPFREPFLKWLYENHQNISVLEIIKSLDRVSEYANSKNIWLMDVFQCDTPYIFQAMHDDIANSKWFRFTKKQLYNFFVEVSARYYLHFLDEMSQSQEVDESQPPPENLPPATTQVLNHMPPKAKEYRVKNNGTNFEIPKKAATSPDSATPKTDLRTSLEEYCRTLDRCTIKEMFKYKKNLSGKYNSDQKISIEVLSALLVRIDKETYIADKHVSFDIQATDEAITRQIIGEYATLKSFAAFAVFENFPECGQTWNVFLLEAYCRRFSQKFKIIEQSTNLSSAGVIVRKDSEVRYVDIMAQAILAADIALEATPIENFLFENGYASKETQPEKIIQHIVSGYDGQRYQIDDILADI